LKTLQELYREGLASLRGFPRPDLDARLLLLKSVSLPPEALITDPGTLVKDRPAAKFKRLIERRSMGEPLAYLLGEKEFWSLPFLIRRGVLVPRPETELVVEAVLRLSGGGSERILDMGTGSGNIAVALAKELPRSRLTAVDISIGALRLAGENAARHHVRNIVFIHSHGFSGLRRGAWRGRYGFVVSNPPYVSAKDWMNLPPGTKRYEPKIALVSGKTGLEFVGALVRDARPFLKPGGYLIFEIGFGQKDSVLALFDKTWDEVRVESDLAGIPRIVAARRS